jgi:hypothetical protein
VRTVACGHDDPGIEVEPAVRGVTRPPHHRQRRLVGNTLVHVLNGHVITVSIDDDPASRAPQGILSLQLEGSGQIWYRNVYVKHLDR